MKELGLSGEQVRALDMAALDELTLVKTQLSQAQTKLGSHRQTLQTVYGDKLRLRCYSVVAVGYERLVWREV